MITNYIYLLQEREFTKTNENIYKVGRTKKENYRRFNQYPKGSVLLFQIICNNCENIETQVIKEFKEKFNQKKDIGNEYFEGDYKIMIDKIYTIIKNEICIVEDNNDELETTDETENDDSDSQNEKLNLKICEASPDYKNYELKKDISIVNFYYLCKRCNHMTNQKIEMIRHLEKAKKCEIKDNNNELSDIELYKSSLDKHVIFKRDNDELDKDNFLHLFTFQTPIFM